MARRQRFIGQCILIICFWNITVNAEPLQTTDLGSDVTLNCTSSTVGILVDITWTLTDHTNVTMVPAQGNLSVTSPLRNPRVMSGGTQLHIANVGYAHLGTYWCSYKVGFEVFSNAILVDVERRPLWEVYKTPAIIGGIAAGVVVGVFAIWWAVYANRWRPPPEEKSMLKTGFENSGYIGAYETGNGELSCGTMADNGSGGTIINITDGEYQFDKQSAASMDPEDGTDVDHATAVEHRAAAADEQTPVMPAVASSPSQLRDANKTPLYPTGFEILKL